MPSYRVLVHPSANRVYAQAAPALAEAELRALAHLALGNRAGAVHLVDTAPAGGPAFVRLTTDEPLAADDARIVATAACAFVVFEEHPGGLLAPLPLAPLACYPDDLLTTLKYAGKTNEQFTALLVNLALAASARGFGALLAGERVRLLDPLCGRGTTLNQALMYGLDAVGVEAVAKDVELYTAFARQWLQDHRIKHRGDTGKIRAGGRTARRSTITITRPGAGPEAATTEQVLDIVNDDTTLVGDHVKGSSVDVVVGDLPYGVHHGARTDDGGRSRHPAALLEAALPVWRRALRGGGALCLAFNTKTVAASVVDELVVAAGLRVVEWPDGVGFEHRVDRTIQRDLVLAIKPG